MHGYISKCLIFFLSLFVALSCNKYEPIYQQSSWMADIHDSTWVCRMSIPGAHDAATGSMDLLIVSNYAKTQALSVEELWDAGVRAFDFRPALVDGKLGIYHDKYSTGTTLSQALNIIIRKLDAQPSDCAVIIIRHESEADGDNDAWGNAMAELLESLPSGRIQHSFRPDLRLGDIRGRLLVLSRQEYAESPVGAYIHGWYSRDSIQRQKSAYIDESPLWIQDYYNPEDIDKKWSCFRNLARDFADNTADVWCINHCSAYLSEAFGLPNYSANAASVNLRASEDAKLLRGIIMMDFAGTDSYNGKDVYGARLVSAVISANYTAQ